MIYDFFWLSRLLSKSKEFGGGCDKIHLLKEEKESICQDNIYVCMVIVQPIIWQKAIKACHSHFSFNAKAE